MDYFVYIHGFNSSAQSRSGRELKEKLGADIIRPEYDYALPFAECLSTIRRQILEAVDERNDRICVMGSSLGGFYALQLRHPAIVHVAAWNPVVFPAMQLEQFLGRNVRFGDGREWEFTRDTLLSYAQAPDPRPWRNETWAGEERRMQAMEEAEAPFFRSCGEQSASAQKETAFPRRDIFLGDSDEILDARLSRAFWQRDACLHDIVSGHQILDYSHAVDILKSGMMRETFAGWEGGAWEDSFRRAASFGMAGLLTPGHALERVRSLLALADAPYLELEGERGGGSCPVLAVFFQPRHEARMKRLLAGLVNVCGGSGYVLLCADGRALRCLTGALCLDGTECRLPLKFRSLAAALEVAFPGWQGGRAVWHGPQPCMSMADAMRRSRFFARWDGSKDPAEAFDPD